MKKSEITLYDVMILGLRTVISDKGISQVASDLGIEVEVLRMQIQRKLRIDDSKAEEVLAYLEKEAGKKGER